MAIEDIEARLTAASPGPWFWRYGHLVHQREVRVLDTIAEGGDHMGDDAIHISDENAEFIAHAREDIEYLVDIARAAEAIKHNNSGWTKDVQYRVEGKPVVDLLDALYALESKHGTMDPVGAASHND